MLRANEFRVATLADAEALSLMLPRSKRQGVFLIGRTADEKSAAVFLDGDYKFRSFECTASKNWRGLLIPNVYIEADETSLFDPEYEAPRFGTLVRSDTRLTVLTNDDRDFIGSSIVIQETGLVRSQDLSAGFSRWRVVIGEGQDKCVLREIDTGQESERS